MRRQSEGIIGKFSYYSDPNHISSWQQKNYAYGFSRALDSLPPKILTPKQIHSNLIHRAESAHNSEDCDGLYALDMDLPIGVRTADCLPVLMRGNSLKMAVHCGWKGLGSGILDTAVGLFREYSVPVSEVFVIFGPCISKERFEVGPEVVEVVMAAVPAISADRHLMDHFVSKGVGDRSYIDLALIAAVHLVDQGFDAKNISLVRSCTFDNPNIWPSYRLNKNYGLGLTSWV